MRAPGLVPWWRTRHAPVRNMLAWVVTVLMVGVIGALGYIVLEHWSVLDAVYMSVSTLTTLGIKEVHPLDTKGKLWTMLLSLVAVGIVFGTVGVVAENIMAQVATGDREKRRMQKAVEQLRGHFIVCGFGRVGSLVARELREEGLRVVVIDIRDDSLQRAADQGFPVVEGNGTTDEVLMAAGVTRARGLVTCIDSDPDNVYVTLSARASNPDLFIVGRASSRQVMSKLQQAGADYAVSPYVMAGHRIAGLAVRPAVVNYFDAAMNRVDMGFAVVERPVNEGSPLLTQTVRDLRTRGLFVLAIHHEDGSYEPNPTDDRRFSLGENLILSGANEALEEFTASSE